MNTEVQQIRKKLRLAMNGVISTSLREKGMNYKLIFGTPIPEIKLIAGSCTPSVSLAEDLWKEDVRELKILATLLYPAGDFRKETALQWIADIKYMEIAEQLCSNLIPNSPSVEEIVGACLESETPSEYTYVCAFLTLANMYIKEKTVSQELETKFFAKAKEVLNCGISASQRSASLALKRYGRKDRNSAAKVMDLVSEYENCGKAELEEIFNDLKFEFEYYFD